MVRLIGSRIPGNNGALRHVRTSWWRPLAFTLAAAALSSTAAIAQDMPIAERVKLCGACHEASDERTDPALVKRGEAMMEPMRCASCHLPGLEGQEQMPRLAKQRIDYLIHSLKEFRDNKRSGADTLMSNVVIGVSDDDIAALAHYAASR
jgi:cytochrome c553